MSTKLVRRRARLFHRAETVFADIGDDFGNQYFVVILVGVVVVQRKEKVIAQAHEFVGCRYGRIG